MDNGTKRKIQGNSEGIAFNDLRASLGFKGDNWKSDTILVSPSTLSSIPSGPVFDEEDLSGAETNVEEEIATFANSFNYNALQDGELNPNNYPITEMTRPSNYSSMTIYASSLVDNEIYQVGVANKNSYDTYREYLKNRIKIVWQSEKRFNLLTDKYNNDIEYGFTESERNKAQTLKEAVTLKLNESRETLTYYKRLWIFVENKSANSADAKKKLLEAQANFEDNINTPITDNERSEYGGWQKGKDNFKNIDLN